METTGGSTLNGGPGLNFFWTQLDAAEKVEDLNLLTLGTHPLKGNRKGEWGMTVTKNWRITFRFEAGDADEVDLEDYH